MLQEIIHTFFPVSSRVPVNMQSTLTLSIYEYSPLFTLQPLGTQ